MDYVFKRTTRDERGQQNGVNYSITGGGGGDLDTSDGVSANVNLGLHHILC